MASESRVASSVLGGEPGRQGRACAPSQGPSRPGGTGDNCREPLGESAAVRSRNCQRLAAATTFVTEE